jgi:protein phosphatase
VIGFDDIEFASLTDVGVRRSHNQDSHEILPAQDAEQFASRGYMFLVADGMGAHAVGELASKIAADSIPHIYSKHVGEGLANALEKAFTETNQAINYKGQQNPEFAGMGTTGSALVLRADGAWIGHVGDSRVYRVRDGKLEQLSFDHSLVWELARRQKVSPEELAGVPSNVIVRSLGPEPQVQIDVEGPHPIEPGDVYLVCSDGLSGPVPEKTIGAALSVLSPPEACRFLIHLANLQGGPDNITAIVARVKSGSRARKAAVDAPASPSLLARTKNWPWSFLCLGLGILLAVLAFYQTLHEMPGALMAFVAGGVALIVGLALLLMQIFRESSAPGGAGRRKKTQVYRQQSCVVDDDLMNHITAALKVLEQRVREQNTPYDERTFRQRKERIAKLQGKGDRAEWLREHCLAMLVLMDALHEHRAKEESFRPLWDKAERN